MKKVDVRELIEKMKHLSGFRKVSPGEGIRDTEITYVVVQGKNILAIGSGKTSRFKVLMGNRGVHNKAPLVGLCHRLFREKFEFYICQYTEFPDGRGCSMEERDLQAEFEETHVEGHRGYSSAMKYVREKLNLRENAVEAILLDLMETHGDVFYHALRTDSTSVIVDRLFDGYWAAKRNAA